jgi:hypothetical protein
MNFYCLNYGGIFKNMIKKFKHSITLMAEIKPDLIPITNYLVWKNDTETNLIDKYLPKEFKDRPSGLKTPHRVQSHQHHWQLMFA